MFKGYKRSIPKPWDFLVSLTIIHHITQEDPVQRKLCHDGMDIVSIHTWKPKTSDEYFSQHWVLINQY